MNLSENPFLILNASVRDSRSELNEKAEEFSLEDDHGKYVAALGLLTHPKRRIAAEISWAPAVQPARLTAILSTLYQKSGSMAALKDLPLLARANLLTAELIERDHFLPAEVEAALRELVSVTSALSPEQVMREINADRQVSGFPQLTDVTTVSEELNTQIKFCEKVSAATLTSFDLTRRAEILTRLSEDLTQDGSVAPGKLLAQLISSYELDVTGELSTRSEHIGKLCEILKSKVSADLDEKTILLHVNEIVELVYAWDAIAQPVQVANRGRGLRHEPSLALARMVRNTATDIWNESHMVEACWTLTKCLSEAFKEIPQMVGLLKEDEEFFAEVERKRAEHARTAKQRQREAEKAAELKRLKGLTFSSTGQAGVLKISPAGVQYGSTLVPLDFISRIRIINRPTLGFALSDGKTIHYVHIPNRKTFNAFYKRIIPAVGNKILDAMLESLKRGESFVFGPAVLMDAGVKLSRQRLFRTPEERFFMWNQIKRVQVDGAFVFQAKSDGRFAARLGYTEIDNVLLLDMLLSDAEAKGVQKLSDLL